MPHSLDQAMLMLAGSDPEFTETRRRLTADWSPEEPPWTLVAAEYGEALSARIRTGSPLPLATILKTVEDLLRDGSQQVRDVMATGFLEALLAESSAGRLDFRAVAKHLGPESRRYCLAWDSFTGVRTPGLDA